MCYKKELTPLPDIRICYRDNWCVDCDDEKCWHHGDIGADCPKWKCDQGFETDCEDCEFIKELYKEMHMEKKEKFRAGDYIIYVNGDRYELGRIVSVEDDGAFVCYHEGETAAKTPFDTMHRLMNDYTIGYTTLGGSRFPEDQETESMMMV